MAPVNILDRESGVDFTAGSLVWELRPNAADLFEVLSADEPGFADVYDALRGGVPVQRRWAFGSFGALSRPDRHVRAFYLHLDKLQNVRPGRGCIAVKGSEPVSDNFDQIVKRMGELWNVFSWTIGGASRHTVEDWALLNQLERFPLIEGKPPGVHPLWDAEEEATCALELQTAHLRRFGRLARIPTPLLVYRLPDSVRDRAWTILQPTLTAKTAKHVESLIADGLGVYLYYYPTLPHRVMHLGGDVGIGHSYEARLRTLAETSDPGATVDAWVRLTAAFLALGWVPTDPGNFSRGYCVMAQNFVLDGGIVDVNSVRAVSSFHSPGELDFAVRQTVRELTQSICWYLVGTDASLVRFQRVFQDAFAYVWEGLKSELRAAEPPAEIRAIFFGTDSVFKSIDRVFRNFHQLAAYRPQDAEWKEYRR